jgi:hypothetical protein
MIKSLNFWFSCVVGLITVVAIDTLDIKYVIWYCFVSLFSLILALEDVLAKKIKENTNV